VALRSAASTLAAGAAGLWFALAPAARAGEAPDAADAHAHHAPDGADDHAGHAPAPGLRRSEAFNEVPDLVLVDQHGRERRLPELLDGGPVLVNFVFTTCTAICPVMSGIFAEVQAQLGDERERVRMVSVSIDPEHDRPPQMAAYAERFRAGPQWSLLTGRLEDCIAVQKAFDAYRGDKMNHAPVTLVRRAPGERWVRYDGFASAADLVGELRRGAP
jgi:protein SCO1/2